MSRNAREGRFVGHAWGKAVRWRKALRRYVRSARARAVQGRRPSRSLGLRGLMLSLRRSYR